MTANLYLRCCTIFSVRRDPVPRILNTAIVLPLILINSAFLAIQAILGVTACVLLAPIMLFSRQRFFYILEKVANAIYVVFNYAPQALVLRQIDALSKSKRWGRFLDGRPKVLYLRPFKMDNRRALAPANWKTLEIEFERYIQQGIRVVGPMIALGNDTNDSKHFGARRISVDDSRWQNEVLRQLDECGHVVIIPENTEGTLWEIERILEDPTLLYKTVFLNLASAGKDSPYWDRERAVYGDDGAAFRSILDKLQCLDRGSIPPLDEIICMFVFGGRLNLICAKSNTNPARWGASPRFAIYLKLRHFDAETR